MPSGSMDRGRSRSPRDSRDYRRSPPRYARSPPRYSRDYERDRRDYDRRKDYRDSYRDRDYRDSDRDRRNGYGERRYRRRDDGRENPKPSNTLGIFGMSLSTTERELREIFEKYGRVESVKIIMDHHSSKSRGFGFITFDDRASAAKARERVADTVIDGMKVRVDFAVERRRSAARDRSPVRDRVRSPIRDRSPIHDRSPIRTSRSRYSRSPIH